MLHWSDGADFFYFSVESKQLLKEAGLLYSRGREKRGECGNRDGSGREKEGSKESGDKDPSHP